MNASMASTSDADLTRIGDAVSASPYNRGELIKERTSSLRAGGHQPVRKSWKIIIWKRTQVHYQWSGRIKCDLIECGSSFTGLKQLSLGRPIDGQDAVGGSTSCNLHHAVLRFQGTRLAIKWGPIRQKVRKRARERENTVGNLRVIAPVHRWSNKWTRTIFDSNESATCSQEHKATANAMNW